MFSKLITLCCLLPASFVFYGTPKAWIAALSSQRFMSTLLEEGASRIKPSGAILFTYGVYYPFLLALAIASTGSVSAVIRIAWNRLKKGDSLGSIKEKASARLGSTESYQSWLARFDTLTETDQQWMRNTIQSWEQPPTLSLILPLQGSCSLQDVERIVASVQDQIYPHWELLVTSTEGALPHAAYFKTRVQADSRIQICQDAPFKACTGILTMLLSPRDSLAKHALFYIAQAQCANPQATLFYGDHDTCTADGERRNPYFKPEWNEALALSHNYLAPCTVYATNLLQQEHSAPPVTDAEHYALLLRCLKHTNGTNIVHIPAILCHIQEHKPVYSEAENTRIRVCIQGYLQETGREANVVAKDDYWHVCGYQQTDAPHVTCIVPAKNHAVLTGQCLEGLLATNYPHLDIILVDNGSTEAEALALCERYAAHPQLTVIQWEHPFNYAEINNMAARQAQGSVLALINNDIQVIDKDWLTHMVFYATQNNVGAVGAKLLYADRSLQHAGVVAGLGTVAGHAFLYEPEHTPRYHHWAQMPRWVAAVTGACLVIEKDKYVAVEGLNEEHLAVAFNDIDLCFKLMRAGYHNVYAPQATLFHVESISRGYDRSQEKQARFAAEEAYMLHTWADLIRYDPYYSPYLSRQRGMHLLGAEEKPYLKEHSTL